MSYVEFLFVKVLGNLIVPPGGVIVLGLVGLMLIPFARRFATFLLLVAVASLYALSTGVVSGMLERGPVRTSGIAAGRRTARRAGNRGAGRGKLP